MTPEMNRVMSRRPEESVGRELSRFGSATATSRPGPIEPAAHQRLGQPSRGLVAGLPFRLMHAACLAFIWVGFQAVLSAPSRLALCVVPAFSPSRFSITAYSTPHIQDRSRGRPFNLRLGGGWAPPGGRPRPILWARITATTTSIRISPRRAAPRCTRLFFWSHMGGFQGRTSPSPRISRV